MSLREEALAFIKEHDSAVDAAKALFTASRSLTLYVLTVGVERLRATERRTTRRAIKAEIQPRFVSGPVTGSVRFSQATKDEFFKIGDRIAREWKIGGYLLFAMTREQVVAHIEQLKASAKGTLLDVKFYSAIVDPMRPGQLVSDVWTLAKTAKLKSQIFDSSGDMVPALT